MNIDYEAIHNEAHINSDHTIDYGYVKAIIEAYEAQKARPEWVPLDLEKVKQGWEVRYQDWPESSQQSEFVCTYRGALVTDDGGAGLTVRRCNVDGWFMRAPKPKTVRVLVWKSSSGKLEAFIDGEGPIAGAWHIVGEDDIEVTE